MLFTILLDIKAGELIRCCRALFSVCQRLPTWSQSTWSLLSL